MGGVGRVFVCVWARARVCAFECACMPACVHARVRARVCMCVCMCVREGDGERGRERERERAPLPQVALLLRHGVPLPAPGGRAALGPGEEYTVRLTRSLPLVLE